MEWHLRFRYTIQKLEILIFIILLGLHLKRKEVNGTGDVCYVETLMEQAKSLLYFNREQISQHILPSKITDPYKCSLTSALCAWALAHFDALGAQMELQASLEGQWNNGLVPHTTFLPTYIYKTEFLNGTLLPGPSFWKVPVTQQSDNFVSGLSSVPLHSQAALQAYVLSGSTAQNLAMLKEMYPSLFKLHTYLQGSERLSAGGLAWSFHPWETTLPLTGSDEFWDVVLNATYRKMMAENWQLVNVTDQIRALPEYPGDKIFGACMYLAGCLRKCGYTGSCALLRCPFRVADVGFNSILSKSNQALYKIAVQLSNSADLMSIKQEEIEKIQEWTTDLEHSIQQLWNDSTRMYHGHYLASFETQEELQIPISSVHSTLPLYSSVLSVEVRSNLTLNLVSGNFQNSFNCLLFPFSVTTCKAKQTIPQIDVFANFLLQRGLLQNKETGLSDFAKISTLDLVSGKNLEAHHVSDQLPAESLVQQGIFSTIFNSKTGEVLPSRNGRNSSMAAAIIINLLAPDGDENVGTKPPITHTTIFVVMVTELIFAFLIGLICIWFSFTLVRSLQNEKTTQDRGASTNGSIAYSRLQGNELNILSAADETNLPKSSSWRSFCTAEENSEIALETSRRETITNTLLEKLKHYLWVPSVKWSY